MEALEIIVVILSVFLGIFLLLAIALMVMLIRVTKKLNDLSDQASTVLKNLGSTVTGVFKGSLTPAMLAAGLFKILRKSYKRKDKDGGS